MHYTGDIIQQTKLSITFCGRKKDNKAKPLLILIIGYPFTLRLGFLGLHRKPMLDSTFLVYFSMNYRDFLVKSKLIISLFQTAKFSLSISHFQKIGFS